jgi:hypothetical protein
MFWNKALKDRVSDLENLFERLVDNATGMLSIFKSFHKRLELQQEMINSLSKQIDIIAQASLFKDAKRAEEIANSKPKIVKPSNENY